MGLDRNCFKRNGVKSVLRCKMHKRRNQSELGRVTCVCLGDKDSENLLVQCHSDASHPCICDSIDK